MKEELSSIAQSGVNQQDGFNGLQEVNKALELQVFTLSGQMSELVKESENIMSVKKEMETEIADLKKKVYGMKQDSESVEGLKMELKKWSEVHKINREAIRVFKERVQSKVRISLRSHKCLADHHTKIRTQGIDVLAFSGIDLGK